MSRIKEQLKKYYFCILIREKLKELPQLLFGPRLIIKYKYKKVFGVYPDLKNPKTLNEKIQWMKLYDKKDFYTIVADKYEARRWLSERFGEEYLIPLLFYTDDYKCINEKNIPNVPCIVKANHTSGTYRIIRDKGNVNWKDLRNKCRLWLNTNYYLSGQEWQYKNIKPKIIVEQLLLTESGALPNDYKLHFFNGKLEFIYCSIDREGANSRNIYDSEWNPLYFTWVSRDNTREDLRGKEIEKPKTFDKMVEIGTEIAKLFTYVRVDFYDVDGKLYYGEITLHHGGGMDIFVPDKYDMIYGNKLKLKEID